MKTRSIDSAAAAPPRRLGKGLAEYDAKRDFQRTPEPRGEPARGDRAALAYTIQKHAARRLHYDVRLELGGTLKCWAVPKGPSLDPADKRLAVRTEDHPLEYLTFQGVIPADQYGGGEMSIWDHGTWTPLDDPERGLARGRLKFRLDGIKLHGGWTLVRMEGRDQGGKEQWLLIKERDEAATRGEAADIVTLRPEALDQWGQAPRSGEIPSSVDAGASSDGDAPKSRRGRGARRAQDGGHRALPETVSPQLATLVDRPPDGEGWIYEVKYDGYRMLARVSGSDVRIVSRNGRDWTAKLPTIASALASLGLPDVWIDGEAVVLQADGTSSFQALQNAFEGRGGRAAITYLVFDLLNENGRDWTAQPLVQRKRRLAELLARAGPDAPVRYAEHLDGRGSTVLARACELGLEGLIGKRTDAPYVGGRTRNWIKLKCRLRQEFNVAGWTDPGGSRKAFGSLVLGYHDEHGKLRYAGRVGTGFDDDTLGRVSARLRPLATERSPFEPPPRIAGVHWVRPTTVAEVAFASWTDDGLVRQASFIGLRDDKAPTAVGRERAQPVGSMAAAAPAAAASSIAAAASSAPEHAARSASGAAAKRSAAAGKDSGARSARTVGKRAGSGRPDEVADQIAGVRITHPDRELFPGTRFTKRDLAAYHRDLAPQLLEQLRGRPLMLLRCPGGTAGQCFHQKHPRQGIPNSVDFAAVPGDEDPHLVANSVEALVGLVQFGAIEFHTWGASLPRLDLPDRLILDLDPDESLPWESVRDAALLVRALLDELGLPAFLKTTGGKGLHVVVPLQRRSAWDEVKAFSKALADHLVRVFPERFTARLAKASRGGKIFVDYLRNAEGATAVAAWSVRARAGAPVSMPIAWEELAQDVRGAYFHLGNAGERSTRGEDPWADYRARAARITAAMRKRLAPG